MTSTIGPAADPAIDQPINQAIDNGEEGTPAGALSVLGRGLAGSPELKRGLIVTVAMGLSIAVSKLTIPVLIQRAIDREPLPNGDLDIGYINRSAAVAGGIVEGGDTGRPQEGPG